MATEKPSVLLTAEDVAQRLQAEPSTIQRWFRTGYIPGAKKHPGLGWRLEPEAFQAFLGSRQRGGEG